MKPDRPHGRVTLADIALETGVSKVTVSYVLNNRETTLVKISDQTRNRVLAAAKDLGYYPNALARGLSRKRTDTITLVMQSANVFRGSSGFMTEMLRGIVDAINMRGFDLMLHTKRLPDADAETRSLTDGRSDGCLLLRDRNDPLAAALEARNHPFVLLFARESTAPRACFVDTDNVEGGRLAAKYLLSLGHRRILFLAGPTQSVAAEDRKTGFYDALKEAGIDPEPCGRIEVNYGSHHHEELIQCLTQRPMEKRPTAIFAWSDDVAVNAIEMIRRECHLSVPDDISVIGFDGTAMTNLTSIRQPIEEITARAIDLLIARVQGDTIPNSQQLLTPTLLVGESCTRL